MTAPIVKYNTDAGMPVLNGTEGQAITFFDYVLVTLLGWTKEFPGVNRAVYRPATGLRRFFRIADYIDGAAPGQGSKKYRITCYESMSTVDSGAGQCGDAFHFKSTLATDTAQPYVVIGDSAGVFIRASNLYELSYFGDGIPFDASDAFLSITTKGYASDDNYWASALIYMSRPGLISNIIQVNRRRSGDPATLGQDACLLGTGLASGAISGNRDISSLHDYPSYNGRILGSRPIITDGTDVSFRGYLPGFYSADHRDAGGGLTDKQIYTQDSKSYIALRCAYEDYSTRWGWVFIDVGASFR